jgi:germination protein M
VAEAVRPEAAARSPRRRVAPARNRVVTAAGYAPPVRGACALFVLLVFAGCAGCAGSAEKDDAPKTRLLVYFVRGEDVGVAARDVSTSQGSLAAAMRALLAGPTEEELEAGLHSEIPDGTSLRSVSFRGDLVTVDLSAEFESGGGSASMLARVAQVVYTSTQFVSVDRVRFRIEGEARDAIGGEGVVVDPPVDRSDFEDQTPAILVESPAPGDTIGRRFSISGTANTFEATVSFRLVDSTGDTLLETFTTATSGSGMRGTFQAKLGFSGGRDGPASLVAFERSAVNGAETKVVEIPVVIRRRR